MALLAGRRPALVLLLSVLWPCLGYSQRGPGGIAADTPGGHVERWAVVVGISDYKNSPRIPDLAFADKDADALYAFLLSPAGGAFPAGHVVKLVNQEATVENVRRALGTFLAKAAPQDLVLIHFSGHGAPDPNNPKILYLLTYDSDPDSLLATALRMDEVRTIIRDYIHSRRVLFMADACHSGGVRGTRAALKRNPINQYLSDLAKSRPGMAFLTASMAGEESREQENLQLGLFTHFFLAGARGAADSDGNGVVTLGETYEFLRSKVVRESRNMQHPVLSGDLDRNVPLGVAAKRGSEESTSPPTGPPRAEIAQSSAVAKAAAQDAGDAVPPRAERAKSWIDWMLREHPNETYAIAGFAALLVFVVAVFILKKGRVWYSVTRGIGYNVPLDPASPTASSPRPLGVQPGFSAAASGADVAAGVSSCASCGARIKSPHDIAGECQEPLCEAQICKNCWRIEGRRYCNEHASAHKDASP